MQNKNNVSNILVCVCNAVPLYHYGDRDGNICTEWNASAQTYKHLFHLSSYLYSCTYPIDG